MADYPFKIHGRKVTIEANSKEEAIQIANQMAQQPAMGGDISKTESALRGGVQGATFGGGDEAWGGINALGELAANLPYALSGQWGQVAPDSGATYEQYRDENRMANRQAQDANPGSYLAGEVAGGLVGPGMGALGLARSSGVAFPALTGMSRLAAGGAASGAASGLGYSEADDARGMVADTLLGTGVGAVAGPAVGKGLQVAGAGLRGLGGVVKRSATKSPIDDAYQRVRDLFMADGYTNPAMVRAALDALGPRGRAADLGANTAGESASIAKRGGEGATTIVDAVTERQVGQQGALRGAMDNTLKPMMDDYYGFIDAVSERGKLVAAPLYEQARDIGLQMTPQMRRLVDNSKFFQRNAKMAADDMTSAVDGDPIIGDPIAAQQEALNGMTLPMMHLTLKSMRDEINTLYRNGNGNKAKLYNDFYKKLRGMVYDQNPKFAEAQGIWASKKGVEEAADFGRTILKGNKLQEEDVSRVLDNYNPYEQEAFRVGLMRGVVEAIEGVNETGNAARRLSSSTRLVNVLRAGFGKDNTERFNNFLDIVRNESIFQSQYGRAIGGSPTAELLNRKSKDMGMGLNAGEVYGLTSGDIFTTVITMVTGVMRRLNKDVDPKTAAEVAKILYGDMTEEQLEKIFRRKMMNLSLDQLDDPAIAVPAGSAVNALADELSPWTRDFNER